MFGMNGYKILKCFRKEQRISGELPCPATGLIKNPSVWFAFLETELMWGVQERLSEVVTPRYLAEGTDSKTVS